MSHEAGGVLTSGRVERVIRERFGYEGLRPGQREEIWAVEVLPAGGAALEETGEDPLGLYERAACDKERHKQFERSRVEMMRGYAELGDCRRGYVLNYFGKGFEEPCGRYDNCEAGIVVVEDEEDEPFPLGSRVARKKWGVGTVQRYEGEEKMVVLFDEVGYKTMMVDLVEEHGLLEQVDQAPGNVGGR